jgi:phytoene dehydrogenase-like protein
MKKNYSKQQNVCIIGAGVSGLAAGVLLSKKGYRVTIFEREKILGGRALSFIPSSLGFSDYLNLLSRFKISVPLSVPDLQTIFEKEMIDGYQLDAGFHLIGGGSKYVLGSEFGNVGSNLEFLGSGTGFVTENGYRYHFFSKLDKIKLLPRVFQLFLYYRESRLKELDLVPISISLEQFKNDKLRYALELFSRGISTFNDLSVISTGETLRSLPKLLCGTGSLGYPIGGLKGISNAYANFIIRSQGTIINDTTVEEIIVKNNMAQGVVVDGVLKNFAIVISSLPVQHLFSIVDESCLPSTYVTQLKNLVSSGGLCAYYSLKKISNPKLLGKTFMFLQENLNVQGGAAFGLIDFKTACPGSGLAPKGSFLVQAYVICTADEAGNLTVVKQLRRVLDSFMGKLLLDFDEQLNWAIYPATQQLEGVAKIISNIKPSVETPIDNLYLIGDCVKASDFGVNCAVGSAKILADIL